MLFFSIVFDSIPSGMMDMSMSSRLTPVNPTEVLCLQMSTITTTNTMAKTKLTNTLSTVVKPVLSVRSPVGGDGFKAFSTGNVGLLEVARDSEVLVVNGCLDQVLLCPEVLGVIVPLLIIVKGSLSFSATETFVVIGVIVTDILTLV